jgi:hypothetical protein
VHEHPLVHDSNHKGNVAEAVIAAEAVKLGIEVLRPQLEHGRYDLVFEIRERFLRVQCKTGKLRGDVIVVPTRTCRHTPGGYARTTYDASEIDLLAVYCHDIGTCYLLPIERSTASGRYGSASRGRETTNSSR